MHARRQRAGAMLSNALRTYRLFALRPYILSAIVRCKSTDSRSAASAAKRSRSTHTAKSQRQKNTQSPVAQPISDNTIGDAPLVPAHWTPTPAEYEALIVDLLIYRRESLGPMIDALREERLQLDASVQRIEQRIAEMHSIREEMRAMIESAAASQRATLAQALQEMGNKDETDEEVLGTESCGEDSEDDEISL